MAQCVNNFAVFVYKHNISLVAYKLRCQANFGNIAHFVCVGKSKLGYSFKAGLRHL